MVSNWVTPTSGTRARGGQVRFSRSLLTHIGYIGRPDIRLYNGFENSKNTIFLPYLWLTIKLNRYEFFKSVFLVTTTTTTTQIKLIITKPNCNIHCTFPMYIKYSVINIFFSLKIMFTLF